VRCRCTWRLSTGPTTSRCVCIHCRTSSSVPTSMIRSHQLRLNAPLLTRYGWVLWLLSVAHVLVIGRGFFKGNFRTAQATGSRGGVPVGETETHCRFMEQILMAFWTVLVLCILNSILHLHTSSHRASTGWAGPEITDNKTPNWFVICLLYNKVEFAGIFILKVEIYTVCVE